jgi:F0F1-type ATP synthase delta subunit
MSVETIARRYGTALADVVIKSGETEPVKNELKVWEEVMLANVDLQNAVLNPSIPHSSKEKVLEALIEKAKPSRTTANFLRVCSATVGLPT